MPRQLLTEQDKIAVNTYMKNGGNKLEACRAAGLSLTHSTRYFDNNRIRHELNRRRARLENKFSLSMDQLLTRYLAIADAHLRLAKYKKVGKSGEVSYDFTDADPDDMAYIGASVSDAKAALDSIAKIMGYDKQKVEITGKDGGPVEVQMTDKELARKLAFILVRGSEETKE